MTHGRLVVPDLNEREAWVNALKKARNWRAAIAAAHCDLVDKRKEAMRKESIFSDNNRRRQERRASLGADMGDIARLQQLAHCGGGDGSSGGADTPVTPLGAGWSRLKKQTPAQLAQELRAFSADARTFSDNFKMPGAPPASPGARTFLVYM